jgi:hypothetical protein
MDQQDKLRVTVRNSQDMVTLNMRDLARQKSLIASGHHGLSKMVDDVRNKLGEHDLAISIVILENSLS